MQIVGYDAAAAGRDPALLVAADGDHTVAPDARSVSDATAARSGSDPGAGGDDRDLPGGGPVERVSLAPGAELEYTLGERHCAGVLADGGHRACPNDRAPYCDAHADDWVCARCTGTCLKAEMDCFQEHAVYLAAFAPATFKVGVTRLERLPTRLREQGADSAAHLRSVSNGRIAREIEAEIATEVGDSVRVPTKIDGLGATLDETAWQDLLADFEPIDTVAFDYGLALDSKPVADTLATGTVRGVKGRVLVLDTAGSTYAVDMRELVGHVVTPERSSRDLQSSLGAFGD